MKWANSRTFRNWASTRACQEAMPLLVRKLIRATCKSIHYIKFPAGDNILFGGWDGVLEVSEGNDYAPTGTSVWEFGTSADPKGKADDDYEKRSKNPKGFDPAQTTFVFVTPQLWQKGEEWVEEKKKDKIWKNIKVINAELLEEWLELAPPVGEWLAVTHLGLPNQGIQATDDFWDRWSSGPKSGLKLVPSLLIDSREKEAETIRKSIFTPGLIQIKSSSIEESTAFIISCFKGDSSEEDFFARSLIVKDQETFRFLITNENPLILIPQFEVDSNFHFAVKKGHTLIVPLGVDAINNQSHITLPPIESEKFVANLILSGLDNVRAKKLSKETARNVNILRRQLEFDAILPEWAKTENVRDIVPALIVGRWDESFESDKMVIAEIANESYDEYIKRISKWIKKPDSPIIKIGTSWRLASHLDAWVLASAHLTTGDFKTLGEKFIEVLSEKNPIFELEPEQRPMASAYGKKREYSEWLREGLTQSLILISLYGDHLTNQLSVPSVTWVDKLVRDLLNVNDPIFWRSVANKLELIAEASPDEFLRSLENQIQNDSSTIQLLLQEDPGFLFPQTYHTHLLYALEGLSWFPQYLSKASLALAKLARLDPGGTISNRPKKSLVEIFLPWHYQTNASFEERIEVLELLANKEPQVSWGLFKSLMPYRGRSVAMSTSKMRWRALNENFELHYGMDEFWETHVELVDLLLSIFDNSEEKYTDLLELSYKVNSVLREKILAFAKERTNLVTHENNLAWKALRKILSFSNSRLNNSDKIPKNLVDTFKELYIQLEPKDHFIKVSWLFEEHWPELPEGMDYKTGIDARQKLLHETRLNAIESLYASKGLDGLKSFITNLRASWNFGDTLAYIITDEDLVEILKAELEFEETSLFVTGLLGRKSIISGLEGFKIIFKKLVDLNISKKAIGRLFVYIQQSSALWTFIDSLHQESQDEYWLNMQPHFWSLTPDEKIDGISRLMSRKKYFTAIKAVGFETEHYPAPLISSLLIEAATEGTSEAISIDGYEVKRIIEVVNESEEIDLQTKTRLEWYYLEFLLDTYNNKGPKFLEVALSSEPEFFVDVLKWAYKPDSEELLEKEIDGLEPNFVSMRGGQAWKLLHHWSKVPGTDENGNLHEDALDAWVARASELATNCERQHFLEISLGQVFAQFPEATENWPPDAICKTLETINTPAIKNSFSAAIFNNHGHSSRGVFDGGEIERAKAEYFGNIAKSKRNKFPAVAEIFEDLAKDYNNQALYMDQKAEKDKLEFG